MASAGTVSYVAGVGGAYDKTAIQIAAGKNNKLICTHGIAANGGGSCVNKYTMMWDVKYPSSGTWKCLLQTNGNNSNDGDFFINTSNKIGSNTTTGGYSSNSTSPNTWYRVVLVVDSSSGTGGNDVIVYVNGSVWKTKYDITTDSTLTLDPTFLISEDDGGEDDTLVVGTFAVWDSALSATDVAGLGAVGSSIVQPVISEGDALTLTTTEDTALNFSVNASDPNADSLTWSLVSAPAHGTVSGIDAVGYAVAGTYMPYAHYNGTDSFVVKVMDPSGLSDTITVTVTTTAVNDIPSFAKGTNLVIRAGSGQHVFPGWASAVSDNDPDVAQVLTFNVSNDNTALFAVQPAITSAGTLSFTPVALASGTATVTMTLTDDAAAGGVALTTLPQTFTITVVNTAPVISAIADRAMAEGQSTGAIAFSVTDAEQSAAALTLAGQSDNPVLVPDANIIFGGSGANRTVTVMPANGQYGQATITIIASDGALSSSIAFAVTVTRVGGATEYPLQVVSFWGGATPPVGTNVMAYGIPVLCSVTNSPISSNGVQYVCTGWTLEGASPAAGSVTNFSVVPTNAMTLVWNWSTNYWVDVHVSGGGELSTTAGWFPAESSLTIRAFENDYWRFTGWVGDVQGCVESGDTLVVPVTRPRGPITALFDRSDLTLTVLPGPGTCVPAPGVYDYLSGAMPVCSAQTVTQGTTQYVCTGWTLAGGTPHVGTETQFTAKLTRDATLAWNWVTNYWLDTAVIGNGSVSLADGWQMAQQPVELVATPAAGYRFERWSGDTNGCAVGGARLIVAMNRARGPVTAHFISDSAFTVVTLPDTQNYCTSGRYTIYNGQCQWVVDNVASRNIQFMIHVGDIVNTANNSTEWNYAVAAMNILNGKIPYNACRGNHDMNSLYLTHFGPNASRWKTNGVYYDWYKGASPSGNSSYQMITYGGRTLLFLSLDVGGPGSVTDASSDIGWAQSVINSHRGILTILCTHDYLAEVGDSSNTGSGTGARGPTCSAYVSGGHSGKWVRENFVLPNNEIFMVICGHNFAQYNIAPINQAGNVVHEIMVDYQTLPNGGNGFLRIMEFKPAEGKIVSSTYSPYLGRNMTLPANSTDSQGMLELTDPNGSAFTIDVDFDHRFDGDLTVTSAYSPVWPAVGKQSFAPGSVVLCSAPDVVTAQTRRRATGWTLSGSQSGSGIGNHVSLVMNGDARLSWQWVSEYWLETAEVGDGQVSELSGWRAEGHVVTLVATPDAGAEFIGWSGDTTGCEMVGNTLSVTMDRARGPITAQFTSSSTIPVYTLTVVSDPPSVTPTPGAYLYTSGAVVRCSAQTVTLGGTQRVCTGWALDRTSQGTESATTVTLDGDRTLTWSWAYRYALSVAAEGPGSVDGASGWLDAGTSVTLHAVADDAAAFVGWEGDVEGLSSSGSTLMLTMDRARGPIVARFVAAQRTLRIISEHGCVAPSGSVSVAYGMVVSNTAIDETIGNVRYACAGWRMEGAEPAQGSSNSVCVVCTNDVTLTWLWATQVLVRVTSEGQGQTLPMDAAGWHAVGEALTVQAAPARLYRFDGWTGDVSTAAATLAFTLEEPLTVHARFVPTTTAAGTPIWWLEARGLQTNQTPNDVADASDLDGDGLTAAQEYQAGTSPEDAASVLAIQGVDLSRGTLTWHSVAKRRYDLLCSTNLAAGFEPVLQDIVGQEGATSVMLPPVVGAQCFWRIATRAPDVVETPALPVDALPETSVAVVEGSFTMGDDHSALSVEKPAHAVTLTPFVMDRTEVSRAAWRKVAVWANAHGYDLPENPLIDGRERPDNHPVTPVSWYEAVKWCNARSEMAGLTPAYYTDGEGRKVYRTGSVELVAANVNWSGNGYRLPTEAEWEYAARGGLKNAQYPWGDTTPDTRANQWEYWVRELNTYPGEYPWTTPVGSFNGTQAVGAGHQAVDTANGLGLYDMAGNVMEWCWDRRGSYGAQAEVDPRGPDTGDTRALRGGSWWNEDVNTRCAFRYFYLPAGDPVYGSIGFRCVRTHVR